MFQLGGGRREFGAVVVGSEGWSIGGVFVTNGAAAASWIILLSVLQFAVR